MLVLGVLIAVAVPAYLGQQAKAQDSATKQYLTVAYKAAKAEAASNQAAPGSYPSGLRPLLETNEPSLDFVDGTNCLNADSRPAIELVYDTDSSGAAALVLYGESDSGKVFRLSAPVNGAPVINHVCAGSTGAGGAEGMGGDGAPLPTVGGGEPSTDTSGGPTGDQPQVDVPVTATPGDWESPDGNPTTTTYQWQACNDAAANGCEDISGAGESDAADGDDTYTPTEGEVDDYLRAKITVCGDSGCTVGYTDPIGTVLPAPPVQTGSSPTISDGDGGAVAAIEGQPLETSNGQWAGGTQTPTSYSYQWFRCTSPTDVLTCAAATGSGNATADYTPNAADVGHYLRAHIGATNPGGTTYSWSDASPLVQAAAPAISGTGPTMSSGSGFQAPGSATANNGSWSTSADGVSYSYQWQRCTSAVPATCADISGATSAAYPFTAVDVDKYVRVLVTATNSSDGGLATTTPTTPQLVTAAAPTLNSAPTLSGSAVPGGTLTAATGAWATAAPGLTYSYQWQRGSGASWSNVGANSSTYSVTAGDGGYQLRVVVTAQNTDSAGRTNSATSAPTSQVGTAPSATTNGASSVGQNSATLNGTVNPNGVATQYRFTGSFGTTSWTSIGAGTSPLGVSASVSGLSAGTTYNFRLETTNAIGSTNGGYNSFTTSVPSASASVSLYSWDNNGSPCGGMGSGQSCLQWSVSISGSYNSVSCYSNVHGWVGLAAGPFISGPGLPTNWEFNCYTQYNGISNGGGGNTIFIYKNP